MVPEETSAYAARSNFRKLHLNPKKLFHSFIKWVVWHLYRNSKQDNSKVFLMVQYRTASIDFPCHDIDHPIVPIEKLMLFRRNSDQIRPGPKKRLQQSECHFE